MIKAIVTDIEGTTSSLSFVKEVLFPYARARLGAFVRDHAMEPAVAVQLEAVRAETGIELTLEQVIDRLLHWIDEDRKATPLKALQGMVWEAGYRDGDFRGHLYEDAARCLRTWHERGMRLYVFSSGSVRAQKLLFAHTAYGDLAPLFSGYYDTTIGNKREVAAYATIAADIGLPAGELLFLSDIREELDAARAAGMATLQLVRNDQLDSGAPHRQVTDFDAVEAQLTRS